MRYFFMLFFSSSLLQPLLAQDLSYFLPDSVTYDPAIPKPKEIIYHEIGEYHVTHDRLVNYMNAIAVAAPNRVRIETMGLTYEKRPQVLLIISSKKNLDRLEQIRREHLQLSDAVRSASININDMPVVVYLGHSIHGNESSGANASLVSAYYLAAAQSKEIDELLDNTVILLDPSFNPDGLQRFSTWANQHKSKNLVTDPNSREFNEVWPGGRFNHYWFDLNRDWLPGIHMESQHRLKYFHAWRPNVLTDHHEQGSNASFFFQPGVPSRVNPLTPARAQELTEKMGKFHAAFLDRIGTLYFTKENYDDFYYGKGSTFPDIHGGIGILFEQASSRGHAQQTSNGILHFAATIKNQFVTALSTLQGASILRKEFLTYQRDFFRNISNTPTRTSYVFGDKYDKAKTFLFVEMLQRHQVVINELGDGWKDHEFEKGSAYIVSLDQPQRLLIRAIFERQLNFRDSLFYDITSWTMPLAFDLPHKELAYSPAYFGKQLEAVSFPAGSVEGGASDYAYLMEWNSLYAPRALYQLQQAGLITKVATNPVELYIKTGLKKFDYGTILLPVRMQQKSSADIYLLLQDLVKNHGVKIYSVSGGSAQAGSDLGSSKFISLVRPSIAMIVGNGVNATDAGEAWHLLDQRMNIPTTHLEMSVFNRVDISKYNTIIMVGGNYNELNKEKLKAWVQAGGNLLLEEEAVTWAAQNGISSAVLKNVSAAKDSAKLFIYSDRDQLEGAQRMSGAIFSTTADLSHPLAFGYTQKNIPVFKANKVYIEKSKFPFSMPFVYSNQPLLSGWASKENLAAVKNSVAVQVSTLGSGKVINIADNPNFRAFWLGGTKLMMNAIFFSRIIEGGSPRTGE